MTIEGGIKVRRWSFCLHCKGRGCPECKGTGKTVELILLSSLPAMIRPYYARAQADFIRAQEQGQKV